MLLTFVRFRYVILYLQAWLVDTCPLLPPYLLVRYMTISKRALGSLKHSHSTTIHEPSPYHLHEGTGVGGREVSQEMIKKKSACHVFG